MQLAVGNLQDPYGYSSLGLMQAANKEEFLKAHGTHQQNVQEPPSFLFHSLQDAPMIEIGPLLF